MHRSIRHEWLKAWIVVILFGLSLGSVHAGIRINIRLGSGGSCHAPWYAPCGPVYYFPAVVYSGPIVYGYPYSPYYYGPACISASTSSGEPGQWISMGENSTSSPSTILQQFAQNNPQSIQREHPVAAKESTAGTEAATATVEDPTAWYREVAEEFRTDAERGVSSAQFNLAALYESGLGVTKDAVEAYRWYSLAGAQDRRDRVAHGMTAEQITDAKSRIAATLASKSMAKR